MLIKIIIRNKYLYFQSIFFSQRYSHKWKENNMCIIHANICIQFLSWYKSPLYNCSQSHAILHELRIWLFQSAVVIAVSYLSTVQCWISEMAAIFRQREPSIFRQSGTSVGGILASCKSVQFCPLTSVGLGSPLR